MTDLLAAATPTPTEAAFARVIALAVWASRRGDEFTFSEVREALSNAYEGTPDAIDRSWSRDKRRLAAVGVELELASADGYLYVPAMRRPGLGASRAASLIAAIRDLSEGDEALETGLRKLLAHGAPILGALVDRARRIGRLRRRASLESLLSVAHLLLVVLHAAGEDGLALDEAVVASGARDASELERVVALLGAVRLPFDGPDDSVPIFVENGRVALYSLHRVVPLPAFTDAEAAALAAAELETGARRMLVAES